MIKLAVAEAALPVASLLVGHQVFGLFDETPTALLTASLINSVLFGYKCRGNIVNAAIITALSILSFYLFGFLFGAPLLQNWQRTASWALFTTSYSTMILVGQNVVTIDTMRQVLLGERYLNDEDALLFIWCVGLANWWGSVVIPLDWNRKWQKWPIPNCICGSVSLILFLLLRFSIQWFRERDEKGQQQQSHKKAQ